MKKIRLEREIDLEKTDFLKNAKFIPGLAKDFYLKKKVVFFSSLFSAVLTVVFAF